MFWWDVVYQKVNKGDNRGKFLWIFPRGRARLRHHENTTPDFPRTEKTRNPWRETSKSIQTKSWHIAQANISKNLYKISVNNPIINNFCHICENPSASCYRNLERKNHVSVVSQISREGYGFSIWLGQGLVDVWAYIINFFFEISVLYFSN